MIITEAILTTLETQVTVEEAILSQDLYERLSADTMLEEAEEYRLEQEEIERLEREKQEAEQRAKEEAERQKRLEEERQRLAQLKPTFDAYNITTPSNMTSEHFYKLLGNTDLVDVAWTFAYAEKAYGINALFLAGLTALESGWGGSERAVRERNLTGYNIVADHSSYAFETRADSVLATAKLIAEHYIKPDGKYHNGLSVWNINAKYCAQDDWADKIIAIANKLLNQL